MNQDASEKQSVPPSHWPGRFFGRHHKKLVLAEFTLVFVLGIFFAWFLWGEAGAPSSESDVDATAAVAESTGPTLWTCSMHPQIRSPKPGKCPICAMDLIPVAKTSGGMRTLAVSPAARALMRIETAPVERRYVKHAIPMVGKVDYDETKLGYITAWVAGRLDRLYVDFTGVEVKKNDHMVYIYSEELYAAQEELIQALKYAQQRPASANRLGISEINLVDSAREKLRLLGLKEEQIKEIEANKQSTDHVTIYSPVSGIVIEKLRQEGERVRLGDRIYTIADLNQVWVHLDAYESDLPWVRYGQDVTITTEAYPGEEFHGRIAFIQPVMDDRTRTVKVRVNVPNQAGLLKPAMFVHAVVRPQVAAGGKVMDPDLAGKWISPMHPEIVKDGPGTCDVCGMPLVRAESLGYVTAEMDASKPPLVIPYLAALVTGTRAIVYVELPNIHSAAEPAFQTLSSVVQDGKLGDIREAFGTYARMLDRPYDQPGTDFAKQSWNKIANQLAEFALTGRRAQDVDEAQEWFARIEATMNDAREQFAPQGQPTFEGREILLGPRAGDYYLVRNGLVAGEMVVTQGNFKIDAEIQIQAKPSMMTPSGGGSGVGHDHGDAAKKSASDEHTGHAMGLPVEFSKQIRDLETIYQQLEQTIEQGNAKDMAAAFYKFSQVLKAVDGTQLSGHPRMLWKEHHMLLSNDAAEGSFVTQLAEADQVFLLLKGHMRRMREQLAIPPEPKRRVQRMEVGAEFQTQLTTLWQAYLPIHRALAGDNAAKAKKTLPQFQAALAAVDDSSLDENVRTNWQKERANLAKLLTDMQAAQDMKALRTLFKPTSEEVGVLARAFGFDQSAKVYELHCPMAFEGTGAIWYQDSDQPQNPYYGSTMLQCADRVEQIVRDVPAQTGEPQSAAGGASNSSSNH